MEKQRVEIGQRFAHLEVIAPAASVARHRAWLCRCDCGGEKVVTESHLKTGHTKSCGCLSGSKPLEAGMHINRLSLLRELPRRKGYRYWLCRCDCGNTCQVAESHIKTGHTKSCGCLNGESQRERAAELYDRSFGRLRVTGSKPVVTEGSAKWLCRCDCGREVYVEGEYLLRGHTRSCGCLQEETRKANMQKAIHFVDGTCIEKIARPRESAANTSGHRGVRQVESGNWRAFISFRGKRYSLGTHKSFEEAVNARLLGEKKYFEEYLESYYAQKEQ